MNQEGSTFDILSNASTFSQDTFESTTSLTIPSNTWYTVELISNGTSITANVYDSNGTLLKTLSATCSYLSSTNNKLLIQPSYWTDSIIHIKNIKVKPL